jgi:hypothetical protein
MVRGEQLRTVNFVNRLQDAWLLQHPHLPQPTHYTQHAGSTDSTGQQVLGNVSGGRIDYIFLSDDLIDAGWLQRTLQHRAFPSDHRPVLAYLQPPGTPESGKGRFPNHLLGVEAFRDQYRSQLLDGIAALGQRSPRLDPAEEWKQIKQAGAAAEEQNRERDRLRLNIAAARNTSRQLGDAQGVQHVRDAEKAYTAFEATQLEQEAAATELVWEVYAEQPTYWFHQRGKEAAEPQAIAAGRFLRS